MRPPVTRARGIDSHGNSCELNTGMAPGTLAEVLIEGGWKYALLDDDGQPSGAVALYGKALERTWHAETTEGD